MRKALMPLVLVFAALLFSAFGWWARGTLAPTEHKGKARPSEYHFDHVTLHGSSYPVKINLSTGDAEVLVVPGGGWLKPQEISWRTSASMYSVGAPPAPTLEAAEAR